MGGIKMARDKRYEEAFKKQIVALYNGGKSLADINKCVLSIGNASK
jgi:transposase-like protein